MTSPLSIERHGDVHVLRMDDGKANVLSHAMLDALNAALDDAEKSARAVVLVGREGRFSAGFDLAVMMSGLERAKELLSKGGDFLLRLFEYPLPLVAASTGHAVAGGALVLLAADVRVASAGPFRIGLNEVQIGLPLPSLAIEFARDRLSPRAFVAATLLATMYDPEGAKDAGYLDEVVSGDALARALPCAVELTKLDARAFAVSKKHVRAEVLAHIRASLARDLVALAPPTSPDAT